MAYDVSVDLQVMGLPEKPVTYELVYEKLYEPEASTYVGKAEEATIYLDGLPDQIPVLDIVIEKVTEAVVEHVLANDATMLRLRIYQGTGAWTDKWKVAFAIHASPFPWAIVIPLIIALFIVIGLAYITHLVKKMDWGEKAIVGLGLGIVLLLLIFAMAGGGKKKPKAEVKR